MIKTLLKSVRQYKKQTLLSPVFVAGEVILECMILLVMSRMIDRMSAESISPIIKYGVILLIMATVSLGFGVLSHLQGKIISHGIDQIHPVLHNRDLHPVNVFLKGLSQLRTADIWKTKVVLDFLGLLNLAA